MSHPTGQRRDRGGTEEGQRRDRGGTEEGQRRGNHEMIGELEKAGQWGAG